MADYRELLLGCGRRRNKDLVRDNKSEWSNLTTCDINADHKPDVIWDLTQLPLPFESDCFDEIHIYEVLEHTGSQGDYKFFFAQFMEFWRILKPGGYFMASVPALSSPWVWGDPSHTRVIQKETLLFLDQTQYTRGVGATTMSDFRYIFKGDFKTHFCDEQNGRLYFSLIAIKPSRITI